MTREEREAAVDWFAEQMKAKLRLPRNEAKGGWRGDRTYVLVERLEEELDELNTALDMSSVSSSLDIISEAADVANFAMMIADKVRHADQAACQGHKNAEQELKARLAKLEADLKDADSQLAEARNWSAAFEMRIIFLEAAKEGLEAKNRQLEELQERRKYGVDFCGNGTLYGTAETCALAGEWIRELIELRRFYSKEKELAESRAKLAWFEERDREALNRVKTHYDADTLDEDEVLEAVDQLVLWECDHPKPDGA